MAEGGPSACETDSNDENQIGTPSERLLERGRADGAFIRKVLQARNAKSTLNDVNSQGRPTMHTVLQVHWSDERATRQEGNRSSTCSAC